MRKRKSRAGRPPMDPSERKAYSRPAAPLKAVRLELAGKMDEAAMLARYEASCAAAPPGGTKRDRVCRSILD